MKKLFLLSVLMLLPILASADAVEINGIYYNFIEKGKAAEVAKNPNYYKGSIVIPESVAYEGKTYNVTSIGSDAFSGCRGLTSVTIPNSVTSIGTYAFNGRSDITYLSIPYSIKSIGEFAFMGCGSSITVNIADPESWCNMQLGNEHASPLSSAGKMLVHDIETTSFTVPETVTSIGAFTFYQCSCLKSLYIPGSVTSIGSSAFEDCDY